jgi:hypothetical protein
MEFYSVIKKNEILSFTFLLLTDFFYSDFTVWMWFFTFWELSPQNLMKTMAPEQALFTHKFANTHRAFALNVYCGAP